MEAGGERFHQQRQVLILFLLLGVTFAGWESRRYSVMEEIESGSFVANLVKDLGLGVGELAAREARVVSEYNEPRLQLDLQTGKLTLNEKLDREEMCGATDPCVMHFQVLLKKPLRVFRAELLVRDINDHAPEFPEREMTLKIPENSPPGSVFPLKNAQDLDVGNNNIQNYSISPNSYFHVSTRNRGDGRKYPELVLDKELDREKQALLRLTLTALDGGSPPRSGTTQVRILILDINDNAPQFAQAHYQVQVPENSPVGALVVKVSARDLDTGSNGEVSYSLFYNHKMAQIFHLDSYTGEISSQEPLDFEQYTIYPMEIQAQDGAGLMARAKVLVKVLDINDNAPEVTITSVTTSVPENFPPGAIIALISVHDQDSGDNGQTSCSISGNLPFKLEKLDDNYYRLVTEKTMDRELTSQYNITITATDQGTPTLSTETHISLQVTDINDNPPTFPHTSYSAYIPENNPRGASIFSVMACDPDSNDNAHVTYSLDEDTLQSAPLSSYISINSDTGVLYALRSFDYEQFRELQLWVTAQDGGNPPLSTNVSVSIFVLDQNDNTPEILYPALPTDGSMGVELAPRSAEPGYLVTKVVAVDRDSGQNAWLSYRLLKASEPGLFSVGLHTGEVRTARALLDRDALKQSLVVAVQDHGQPPLSATVTLTVAVADSIPDVLTDLGSLKPSVDPDDSGLTLYLVVAVAAVSCVFLAFVIVLLALRLRHWHTSRLLQASGSGLAGVPASQFVGVDGVRAFLQTYSHEVSLTADSRGSHILVTVLDVNDNAPEVTITSLTGSIPENSPRGTLIALLNVNDKDSGENGRVTCFVLRNLPFKLEKSYGNYYSLMTDTLLDRELVPSYNITVMATDRGSPPLSTETDITLHVADINDNAPAFSQASYSAYILENNPRGASIISVTAYDPDYGENAQVTYSLVEDTLQGAPLSSYVSINSDTGVLYALRSFDYEQLRDLELQVMAHDSGDVPLSSNVSLSLFVLDQNDNSPEILFPVVPTDGSTGVELAPRSAEPGYLVTKVVAVDRDSGQNAWLSYRLLKASEPGLFSVGLHTGEFVGVDGVRAFLQTYSHEVSLTADSRGSHVIFPQPNYADTLISQESCGKSEPLLLSGDSVFSKDNHALIQSPALAHFSCSYWLGLCVPLSANGDAGDLAPARPLSAPRDEAETEQPASKSAASRKPCPTRSPAPER
ncbi:unnamed protein product [Rangifer tarandus platyrhynchus]|uniref:Cadherin domain-containing protein n=1 Tax=Rangifer tarandus platyrhynchus TaxID=3082113 RepID=A0ABN8ZFF7_RANTA|nr:unnamed protein product [Rangifer tarandus platyrhynchus]